MSPELHSLFGTLATVGGSVLVAIVGAYGLIASKRTPTPGVPTPIQDVWDENRKVTAEKRELAAEVEGLEARLDSLTDEFRSYRREKDEEVFVTKSAVEVLWRYVERIKASWGADAMPQLGPSDRALLQRVMDDVSTPPRGIPRP